MSNDLLIARPYAKAAFEFAKAHDLTDWLRALAMLAEVVNSPKVHQSLQDPLLTADQHLALIKAICAGCLTEPQQNFLALLAENKRLLQLPSIFVLFHQFYEQYQQVVEAHVFTAYPLSDKQTAALVNALKKRFNTGVLLTQHIDPRLMGGLLIRVGDEVIDGSVKGRLERLATHLNLKESLCL